MTPFFRTAGLITLVWLASTFTAVAGQSGRADLADAARADDKATVLALLKSGADVNAAQGDGSTALHWTAYHGNLETTQALLKAAADVNARTRIGEMSPLFMAARRGHAAVLEALLKAGADAREVNSNGTTVLMIASASGNPDAVRLLLDRGANPNATDATNGQTALMFAAARNAAAVIKVLTSKGADPNVRTRAFRLKGVFVDENGNPVPPEAAAAAAENRPSQKNRNLGAPFMGGMSALHFAAREGHLEAARELLAGGADINLGSADRTPPMTEALINGHVDLAKALLDRGADPRIPNVDGLTPLYAIVDMQWRSNTWYPQPEISEEKTSYLDFMRELVDRGANVNARLERRLWFRTFRYGQDWVDPAGATPFWRAAQANDIKAMRFLIANGADPRIPTAYGATPLMVASGLGFEYQTTIIAPDARLSSVQYLVAELRQDPNAKDSQDYTALHGAAYVGDNNVIRYLVSKGGDIKARASGRLGGVLGAEDVPKGTGDTVADMANGPREKSLLHPETLKLVESLGAENSQYCRSNACINGNYRVPPGSR